MKEGASQTVQRYRGHGLLASVHLRTHKIQSTQNGRENLLSSKTPETPTSKKHVDMGPVGLGLWWPRALPALSSGLVLLSLGLPRRLLPLFCRRRPPSFVLNQCAPKISPKKTVVAFWH